MATRTPTLIAGPLLPGFNRLTLSFSVPGYTLP
jgi:hypothetical protein